MGTCGGRGGRREGGRGVENDAVGVRRKIKGSGGREGRREEGRKRNYTGMAGVKKKRG